jgi:hypothetical protein
MNNMLEPRCSARPRRKHIGIEAFGEYAPTAQDSLAIKAACKDHQANWATCDRQISQSAAITAMDPCGLRAATRAGTHHSHGAHHDQSASFIARHVVDGKAAGHESGSSERGLRH